METMIQVYETRIFELVDPRNSSLEKITNQAIWSEGPVYFPEDDSIIWSDAHGNRLLRWSPSEGTTIIRDPSDYQSGNYRDLQGRLVSCSSGKRAVIRREDNGEWKILVDRYLGKRLNSPNDLVVKSDGTIWFTDPPYGLTQPNQGYGGKQEQPGAFVYCFDPQTEEIEAVVTDMLRPNGIAFNPDETILYVSDTAAYDLPEGPHHIRAYQLKDGQVGKNHVFAVIDPGQPDGFRCDKEGNLYISAADGIHIYAPDGTILGKILVPEVCSNLTFGGKKGNRLFITAGHSLYAISLKTYYD